MADAEIAVVLKLIADQFQSQMKNSENSLESFASKSDSSMKAFGATVLATGAALVAMARESGKAVEELDQLHEKTGIAMQSLQEMSVLMGENSLGPEQMASGIKFLSKAMMEFKQGEGKGFELFSALNIDPSKLDVKGTMDAVHEKLLTYAPGDTKTDYLTGFFGKGGQSFAPMMAKTGEEWDAAREKAYEYGLVLGDLKNDKLLGMDDQFDDLSMAIKGFKQNLSALMVDVGFAGWLGTINHGLADVTKMLEHPWDVLAIKVDIAQNKLAQALTTAGGFWARMLGIKDDVYASRLKGLEEEGAGLSAKLNPPAPTTPPKPDTRPPAPDIPKALTGVGGKAVLKTQEEELKAELEGLAFFAKQKEQLVQTHILKENLDERHAVQERLAIHRDETAQKILAIQKIFPMLEEEHTKELAAAGGVAEKKIAADENYKQKRVKYDADIRKLLDEGVLAEGEAANKILAINNKKQETLGKMIVDHAKLVEDLRKKNIKDEETAAASLVTIGDMQLLGSVEMATRKIAAIRAQIATLQAEVPSADRDTKIAEKHVELDQQAEIQSNSFLAGWARGMKTFTRDSTSAFGQAQIMARDTAAKMQSGFETLFFDAMNNKFHSLKDVATSVFTFMQQLAAKTLAQYATTQVLGGQGAVDRGTGLLGMLTNFMGGGNTGTEPLIAAAAARGVANPGLFGPGFAEGGFVHRRYFATGGPAGTDTIPAWLSPGEGVLSNTGMAALDRLNAGNGSSGRAVHVHMTVYANDAGSFRKSQDQILMDVQRAMGRAQRNA